MADDDRRVEPRTRLVGSGAATTPERIAEIEERRRQLEKLERRRPAKPFDRVLQEGAAAPAQERGAAEPSTYREDALPQRGPRPALAHPQQQETYGRDKRSTEKVVLKG